MQALQIQNAFIYKIRNKVFMDMITKMHLLLKHVTYFTQYVEEKYRGNPKERLQVLIFPPNIHWISTVPGL